MMGREAKCSLRVGKKSAAGRAWLETDEIVFRGDARLVIPLGDVRSVSAKNGVLRVAHRGGIAAFSLGPLAEKWAEKIRRPPSLLDKLGVKAGARVTIFGRAPRAFLDELRARTSDVARRARNGSDIVFVFLDRAADLARVAGAAASLAKNGALWTVRPKGPRGISESATMAAGKAAGLVDVKVARFSETHTAEKFVIPLARR